MERVKKHMSTWKDKIKGQKTEKKREEHKVNSVLLAFPSRFSEGRMAKLVHNIRAQFRSKNIIQLQNTSIEKIADAEYFVFKLDDVVQGAAIVRDMFGIDKVAIAKQVSSVIFEDISAEIVKVGKLKILPTDRFFVKVQISRDANVNYKPRDLEFVSTGDLIVALQTESSASSKLSVTSSTAQTRNTSSKYYPIYPGSPPRSSFSSHSSAFARPAKNELEATRTLESYVGKKSSYICIEMDKGPGGLPFGCQEEKILCPIYSLLSTICCLAVLKCGFLVDIVIFYTDEDDLRQNVKTFGMVASRMNASKCSIRVAKLELPSHGDYRDDLVRPKRGALKKPPELPQMPILKEIVATAVLTSLKGHGLAVPMSVAIHPLWLIESTFKKIMSANKMPWMPLLLPERNTYDIAAELGIQKDKLLLMQPTEKTPKIDNLARFTKQDYTKHSKAIETMTKFAFRNMKKISFKVGPNYLHDILDAV
jgi:hypothetical protein